MNAWKQFFALLFFLTITFAAAALGARATDASVRDWYPTLVKPSWNPPAWVFGPVWSTLFLCMAIAAWLVWRQRDSQPIGRPMVLYFLQLLLNVLWSVLFFALQRPSWAAVEIVILWLAISATLVSFWRRNRVSGGLFAPYLAWVTFAAVLNFTIARLNP